jgi:CRISPR-associated protein Cas2
MNPISSGGKECPLFWAISYDISDDRRRLKVANILKDFGERVQLSVFEANIEQDQVERLKKRVNEALDHKEDTVRLYPLCTACVGKVEILGQGVLSQDPDFVIV